MLRKLRIAAVLTFAVSTLLVPDAIWSEQPKFADANSISNSEENQGTANGRSWIVRDPATGRLYQQELVSVAVPTTHWEVKPVPTTVYEPKSVVKSIPTQQTVFSPSTQYVMQPKLRGWWNPMRPPVQAYEFVPVTSWQPQTQTFQTQVATVEWEPRQQVVYVPHPVQSVQTHQQIVSKELPQSPYYQPGGVYPSGSYSMLASQSRPLVTIPILARQRVLPSVVGSGWQVPTAEHPLAFHQPMLPAAVSGGLRPFSNAITPNYTAPLQTASRSALANTRDLQQAGMSPTILR